MKLTIDMEHIMASLEHAYGMYGMGVITDAECMHKMLEVIVDTLAQIDYQGDLVNRGPV